MANKYEEALNHLKSFVGYPLLEKYSKKDFELLQELIDKTTICGLSLDEAIPVIEMYKQLKQTTHHLDPIEDLMMGQKGQYYINGISIQEQINKYEKLKADYIVNGAIPYYIYKELKDELDEYKKKEKKIINKKIKRAYQLMKESGYFDE